jgi:hypothetical protein
MTRQNRRKPNPNNRERFLVKSPLGELGFEGSTLALLLLVVLILFVVWINTPHP